MATSDVELPKMTKSAQRWVPAGVPAGVQLGFRRRKGVPARLQQRVSAHKGVRARGSNRGSSTLLSPLFPCISAHMHLLAPLVDSTKATRAAVGTRDYAGPDGLRCTDLSAHPDTKLVIPPSTTIARIPLNHTLFGEDKHPCALTDWLHGVLEDNPHIPIVQVSLHGDDIDEVVEVCTASANPTVNKTQRRHVGLEGTTPLFAAHKLATKKARKDKYPSSSPTSTPSATWWTACPQCPSQTTP